MTASEDIRNFINELDAIFESEDELLDTDTIEEVDEACQSEPSSTEQMAPKKTKNNVQDYSRPKDGQSFAERKGFTG